MTAEIIELGCDTTLDLPPEKVLNGALGAELESVVICGWQKDGQLYCAASQASRPEILYLLALAQKEVLDNE